MSTYEDARKVYKSLLKEFERAAFPCHGIEARFGTDEKPAHVFVYAEREPTQEEKEKFFQPRNGVKIEYAVTGPFTL